MLEVITDLPSGVEGVRASGKVTRDDYQDVLLPLVDRARAEGRKIRFLYQFGADFTGFSAGAAFTDLRLGFASLRLFERLAVVTDLAWLRDSCNFVASLMPIALRVYPLAERDDAALWLAEPPTASDLTHRLLADKGVVVLEITGKLGVEDFDALSLVVDPWIESHGALRGLVLHARRFPGWEGLGGMLRHLRFVREHHRKIERIAVVSDSALHNAAPALAEHFIAAEVKGFDYDHVDAAIEWAAEGRPDDSKAAS